MSPFQPAVLLASAVFTCSLPPLPVDTQLAVLPPFFLFLRVSTVLDMPYLDTRSEGHLWLRDFSTQIQPNETQRNTLIVAGVYVIVIFVLWCVSLFLYSSVH